MAAANGRLAPVGVSATLTLGVEQAFAVPPGGSVVIDDGLSLVNLGTMTVDDGTLITHESIENAGVTHLVNDASVSGAAGVTFGNTGSCHVDSTSSLSSGGGVVQAGGEIVVNGVVDVGAGTLRHEGGVLRGSGTIDGVLLATGGIIEPGEDVDTVADLAVIGGCTLGTGTTLVVGLGGLVPDVEHDLVVTGTATLGGTLVPELVDGYRPEVGHAFTVVAADAVSGTFDALESTFIDVTYEADAVVLTVTRLPADVDGDGTIGFADLLAVLSGWGSCDACPEDIDGDGLVSFADLLQVLSAWT